MPKTITDDKLKYAIKVVEAEIEPRIKKLITTLNETFAKHGIRAGAELQWVFDEVGEPNAKPEGKKG